MRVLKKRSLSLLIALAMVIQCVLGNAAVFGVKAVNAAEAGQIPDSVVYGVYPHELKEIVSSEMDLTNEDEFIPGSALKGNTPVASHDWYTYSTKFYYQSMSAGQKKLYQAFYAYCMYYLTTADTNSEHPANYKSTLVNTGTSLQSECLTKEFTFSTYGVTQSEADTVFAVFLYENPQFYFVDANYFRTYTGIYLTFYDLFMNSVSRANTTNQIFSQIDTWASQVAAQSTPYNKVKKAQDIICEHNIYGWSTLKQSKEAGPYDPSRTQYWNEFYDQSLYSSVILKVTVCAGYSKLTMAMLRKAGVNSIIVTSSSHAWNMVKVGKNWYNLDTTWDDDSISASDPVGWFFLVSDKNLKLYDNGSGAHNPTANWTSFGKPVCSNDYSDSTYMTAGQSTDKTEVDVKADFQNKWIPEVTPVVTLSTSTFTYTGGPINPTITVMAGGYPVAASNYEVSYPAGAFNVGDHQLTVKLKPSSGFSGTAQATYIINPKATAFKGKLKAGSGSIKLKVKKVTKQASGYQIQYSLKKNFKGKKTVNLKGFKKTSTTIKKLKKHKKYYVRVRTYKTVDGEKYYSAWSKVKTVKTK